MRRVLRINILAKVENKYPHSPANDLSRESNEDRFFKRIFLSPAVTILLILSIFPLVWSLGVSLTNCQRTASQDTVDHSLVGDVLCLGNPASVSLRNFGQILSDARLLNA